jgi:lysine 6-dehydrogenase
LGIINTKPIIYNGIEIVPIDFFNELIYPLVKFDENLGDRDITVLFVSVTGRSKSDNINVNYEMVDIYDEIKGITSMAKTTGYTAAIILRMLARGEIKQKGIQWPVRVIKGHLFEELLRSLRERGIKITERVTKIREIEVFN